MFCYVNYPKWIKPEVVPFLPVRWYAVMYIVAFVLGYMVFEFQRKHDHILPDIDEDTILNLFSWTIVGLILGGRIFSTLFYEGNMFYWTHPWLIFWPFRDGKFIGLPGMSYHGGVIGAVLANFLYCRRKKLNFPEIADAFFLSAPLGYTFGRIGNFINGELWGRCTGSSFGMIFPDAPHFSTRIDWVREAADMAGIPFSAGQYVNLPRHPSQLYEAFFEGIFLFLIMWFLVRPYTRGNKAKFGSGFLGGFYFAGYGFVRFVIEYFREPDEQLGFLIALGKETEPLALFKSFFNISFGQILCFGMIVFGLIIMILTRKRGIKSDC